MNVQFFVVALSNFAYGTIYLRYYKNVLYFDNIKLREKGKTQYLAFCIMIFLATLYLVSRYGWHDFTLASEELEGPMYTLTAYVKYLFVSCYLYYLYRYGMNRGAIFLMIMHTIIMFVDGGRTTYLPLLVLTMIIYYSKQSMLRKRPSIAVYGFIVVGIVLSILARALVMGKESSLLVNMTYSVLAEASGGSYMSLQVIHSIINGNVSFYTFGTTYLFDPFVWFIPQGVVRESFLTFNNWVSSITPYLGEKFAPMGGFYYIAEAMAFLPYLGPIIVTAFYGLVSVWIENKKNRYRVLYLSYFPTIGLLFSKAVFANIFKLFVFQLVLIGVFVLFRKLKTTSSSTYIFNNSTKGIKLYNTLQVDRA